MKYNHQISSLTWESKSAADLWRILLRCLSGGWCPLCWTTLLNRERQLTGDQMCLTTDFEWGRDETEQQTLDRKWEGTIWNVTELVSGPGHGHDYVQITLGQSPSPHPPDPAHAEQGPEKYKHALLLSLVFGIYLIYDLMIPRSLVENGIKSIILLVLSSLELITENRELEDRSQDIGRED